MKHIHYLGIALFLLVAITGCSTKKNTIFSRTYHGVTAKYNGYFNGKLRLKDGITKLANAHEDKYDRTLSIFKYANAQKAKTAFPDLDEVIKKASIVIQRHSIEIKGKEYNKWIDDSYMLLGQAHFYKHDYFSAIETFQYVAGQYPNSGIKDAAVLWAMKTNLELGRVSDANNMFDYLNNSQTMSKNLKGDFYATTAHMHLQQKNYPKTIEYLEKAIPLTSKRAPKTRYTFILAQLYQGQNDYQKAYKLYEQVIKLNPVYEMAFNAKISKARSFDPEGKDSKAIKTQLQKMIRDDKNIEYLDQIYYALAGIAQKENDLPLAMEYLQKSVESSVSNDNQKAFSYLELARIWFDKPDYRKAQTYYDSTITFLAQDYPEYNNIKAIRNSLSKVVQNLNTLELEDSLQVLASYSMEKRVGIIDEIVALEMEAQQEKQRVENEAKTSLTQLNQTNPGKSLLNQVAAGSAWYFYNPQALSLGYTEFIKKWGQRKLEDSWRRSDKSSIAFETEDGDEPDSLANGTKEPGGLVNNKTRYLKAIPVSEKMLEKSDAKIEKALYNLGLIYREQLNNPKESSYYFEELLRRFPANENKLATYYQLYRNYTDLFDNANSEKYKNILLNQYPDSEFSMVIRNPGSPVEKATKTKELFAYYEATYLLYKDKQYVDVINRKAESDSLFPYNELVPKFDYLKTLAVGKTRDIGSFENSLKAIVINYPSDPVKTEAMEILAYLDQLRNPQQKQNDSIAESIYKFVPDAEHMVVVSYSNAAGIDLNDLKVKISDYNTIYYSLKGLTITSAGLDDKHTLVMVKGFLNGQEALEYFDGLNGNSDIFTEAQIEESKVFAIASPNMPTLYKEKNINQYLTFFAKSYQR